MWPFARRSAAYFHLSGTVNRRNYCSRRDAQTTDWLPNESSTSDLDIGGENVIVALLVKVAVIWNFLASTMIDRSIFSPSHVAILLISIVRLELSIDVITVAAGIHRPLTGRPLNCSASDLDIGGEKVICLVRLSNFAFIAVFLTFNMAPG